MGRANGIAIYDTTLRDGTQAEAVSLSVEDKLHIARRLDGFGVHYIEGGWPGSNPKDAEFFRKARDIRWSHSKIAAFGSTRHARNRVESDPNIQALLEAETPVVTLVAKSWDFHVHRALNVSLEENLDMIEDSVTHLKKQGREVIFDAEHFFDGYRANEEYAEGVLDRAAEAGADWLVLCDTNGGNLPTSIADVAGKLSSRFKNLGIHTHNDCELAVANSLAAVEAGARMVQGTINGYGERTGNANLTSIMALLELKTGYSTVGEVRLQELTSLSHYVAETANLSVPNNLPFVGRSCFAHKGGIHVNALMKDSRTYEHAAPESVGNRRRVLVSDLSGKSNLRFKLSEFGFDEKSLDLTPLLERIKRLEFEGYQFEGADGSLRLLARRFGGDYSDDFEPRGFRIVIDQKPDGRVWSEATVRVSVRGEEEHTAADGNGPVNALARALTKALSRFFPELDRIRLTDYKVRVLDAGKGTASKVRVLVESSDGDREWTTVGVSTNVIEASWKALIDAVLYGLAFAEDDR